MRTKEKCTQRINKLNTLLNITNELSKTYDLLSDCTKIQMIAEDMLQEEVMYAYKTGLLQFQKGSDNDV